ncbi:MAG TPA: LysM peptidoglycan-binding domain-containing protein [Planctomycetota bacterium]|nr:LysM peptidoglycan-binding domain-containing protein [Planctomycetota bacterium]
MSMLHGVLRTATVALIVAIALLVYINYFRSNAPTMTSGADVAAAPEAPKLAVGPDLAPPAVPAIPVDLRAPQNQETGVRGQESAASVVKNVSDTLDKKANSATAVSETMSSPLPPRPPRVVRAEIIDNGPAGEVVELPPQSLAQLAAKAPASYSNAPAVKRTHVVQPGESLWLIAKKYYGNGELFGRIAEGNGIAVKDRVKVGQVLVIPDQNAPPHVSEDLADHEDAAPRAITVSSPHEEKPATMSSTFHTTGDRR